MAVQSDTSRIQYAGNNSTSTSYAVPFVFQENAHLKAIARTAEGVETVVTLNGHTGAGDPNGGTVLTTVAVPATSTLTIYREVPLTQSTIYQEGGDFPAASHERALDKLTMAIQQIARSISRTVRLSDAAPESTSLAVLPNRFFGTDENGAVALVTGTDAPAGSLTNANIANDAAISLSKLAVGALPTAITVATDNLVAGAVTTAKIGEAEVANSNFRRGNAMSVVGRSANSIGFVADISAFVDGQVLRRSGTVLGFGQVASAGIANAAVTPEKLNGGQSGSAPVYGCRAWVNFDGSSYTNVGGEDVCSIRSSGNVSKVVRLGLGIYEIHFTTAMADGNYSVSVSRNEGAASALRGSSGATIRNGTSPTASSFQLETRIGANASANGAADDATIVCAQIFR